MGIQKVCSDVTASGWGKVALTLASLVDIAAMAKFRSRRAYWAGGLGLAFNATVIYLGRQSSPSSGDSTEARGDQIISVSYDGPGSTEAEWDQIIPWVLKECKRSKDRTSAFYSAAPELPPPTDYKAIVRWDGEKFEEVLNRNTLTNEDEAYEVTYNTPDIHAIRDLNLAHFTNPKHVYAKKLGLGKERTPANIAAYLLANGLFMHLWLEDGPVPAVAVRRLSGDEN